MGIFLRFAAIAARQLFVSPSTKKASGFSLSKTVSILIRMLPIVSIAVPTAESKK